MTEGIQMLFGFAVAIALVPAIRLLFKAVTVEVEDETEVLITNFGKVVKVLKAPGLHWVPSNILPWVRGLPVSLQRDFRHFQGIQVNDRDGTTMVIDLWTEFRIVDSQRALFHVEDWEDSLKSLLIHSASSILGAREFKQILSDRNELGTLLLHETQAETSRWGLELHAVYLRKISVLPEVARQMFETVAARLERAKAAVEEEGRLRVALLEAETSAQVASLVAEAKGQYPAAVGRAYAELKRDPELLEAYEELHKLSLLKPSSMIAFAGFGGQELRVMDAAMASGSIGALPETV